MEINEIGDRKPTEKKINKPQSWVFKKTTNLINKPLAKLIKSKKKKKAQLKSEWKRNITTNLIGKLIEIKVL